MAWIFPVSSAASAGNEHISNKTSKRSLCRANFRNCFPTAFGILGNSRFPRLCVEVPIPKGKAQRLREGWDCSGLPKLAPCHELFPSCSPSTSLPSGCLFCFTRELREKQRAGRMRAVGEVTEVAGRKVSGGRSQRNSWQRLR